MDKSLRNTLRNVVTQCRRLLEESVTELLEGQFGIYITGKIEPVDRMKHLSADDLEYREQLLIHLQHIQAAGSKVKDAVEQLVREVAFTHLNRFCAYKMMETRGLIRKAVSDGLKSQGFLFYLADNSAEERLYTEGKQDVAYRHFLEWLGSTLSEEIGVLFSPYDPANRLLPPQRIIDSILNFINSEELKDIWVEDETIGWVYQYFTPKELRDKARKESQAPRNSYELAFRNQFYTPSYVVQFLTDNTLGRIWYEMRQGETVLTEHCKYLVRRPHEVFLALGEEVPVQDKQVDDLSQEELLKQRVYIVHRPKKDPREIKILDPACGSGHFLLYCFSLLLIIYEEAYDDPDFGLALQQDYPDGEEYRKAIPGLILAHNLHGIDIDIRATQIAALAVWLRAQRAYQEMGIKKNRPKITKSNIVCAEPMPGEKELLDEFVTELQPKVLGRLVQGVFEKMKLAGEAGSLLKIEEEIRHIIAEYEDAQIKQLNIFDLADITDKEFWNEAETKVIESLREYANYTVGSQRFLRQLFASDAVQGFAFIDICQKQFDIILMNPPFGFVPVTVRENLQKIIPISSQDIFAAFVERWIKRLFDGGILGAITGRLGFYKDLLEPWRRQFYGKPHTLKLMADLGYGVLDDAVIEAAAYVIDYNPSSDTLAIFINELTQKDKQKSLVENIKKINLSLFDEQINYHYTSIFNDLPNSIAPHWCQISWLQRLTKLQKIKPNLCEAKLGLVTGDNFKFLRLTWEITPGAIQPLKGWTWFVKGGEYEPYYSHIHLAFNWAKIDCVMRRVSLEYYGIAGGTYTERTTSNLSVRVLPPGCIINFAGPGIYQSFSFPAYGLVALLNSAPYQFMIELIVGGGDTSQSGTAARHFLPSLIEALPAPNEPEKLILSISNYCRELYKIARIDRDDETREFFYQPIYICSGLILSEIINYEFMKHEDRVIKAVKLAEKIDLKVADNLALSLEEREELRKQLGRPFSVKCLNIENTKKINKIRERLAIGRVNDSETENGSTSRAITKCCFVLDNLLESICHLEDISIESLVEIRRKAIPTPQWYRIEITQAVVSYVLGCVLGRWDIRFATGEKQPSELPDPFAPLPVCSPGMLTGEDGLPLRETPFNYPIQISWDSILVDDPDHPDDIIRRVRDVLQVIWGDKSEAIEQEACEILGVKNLRDYFRKPSSGGFWTDHIKRYSKSRRKAPIYWLLQSSKKNYSIWIYYHRLDKDILFKALVNYVEPKLRLEESNLQQLRSQKEAAGTSGKAAKQLEKQIDHQESLISELYDFQDKLRRAANLNLEPDLNDGVVLNIAPLWEIVPWSEAKKYWQELTAGKYEWSSIGKQLRAKGIISA